MKQLCRSQIEALPGSHPHSPEPLDMDTVIKAAIETDDELDELRSNGPEAILEQIGWPNEGIFGFYWQSMGPMVWECYLNTLYLAEDTALAPAHYIRPLRPGDENHQTCFG